MNKRDYKTFREGEYYHLYNRGLDGTEIFKDEEDYNSFLYRLNSVMGIGERKGEKKDLRIKPFDSNSFVIISFCLMPNHYHLLLKQNGNISVSQLMSKVVTSYAMYFNKKNKRVGPLFRDSFKAVNVENDKKLLLTSAYIHQNPAVAGLVWDLKSWKWNSYLEYLKGAKQGTCHTGTLVSKFKDRDGYREFVEQSFDEVARLKKTENFFLD